MMYTGDIFSRFAFGEVKGAINMFRVAFCALGARESELAASSVDDNWLLLGRMTDEYFNVIVANAGVTIDGEGMLGKLGDFGEG